MKEERRYKVVDLFAGAGGFGLGFHLANYKVILSLEIDKWAVDTLNKNRKKLNNPKVIKANIRDYTSRQSIHEICKIKPDIIIGGPPCQGFSIAGSANKKAPNDPRNNLFNYYATWLKHLEPNIFVMENVKGILSRTNSHGTKVIDIIKNKFIDLGYTVEIWRLNAANYGVPQSRERIFIVGNRYHEVIGEPPPTNFIIPNGNGIKSTLQKKQLAAAITVGEALSDLPDITAGEGVEAQPYTKKAINKYQKWARRGQDTVYNHVAMNHRKRTVERFKQIQNGVAVEDLPDVYKIKKRSGNGQISEVAYNSNYRHLDEKCPSFTIPAYFYSSFIHPNIPRNITAREAARLQSFPDWYIFQGKRTVISSKLLEKKGEDEFNHLSQYNQIGNAVPPLLAKAIGSHILMFLNRKNGKKRKKVNLSIKRQKK